MANKSYLKEMKKEIEKNKDEVVQEIEILEETMVVVKESLKGKKDLLGKLTALNSEVDNLSHAGSKKMVSKMTVENQSKYSTKHDLVPIEHEKVKFTKKQLLKMKQSTMVSTIYEMLKGREMHYKDIIEELKKIGYTKNTKQPELNINSLLSRDERFDRVGKGIYTSKPEQ